MNCSVHNIAEIAALDQTLTTDPRYIWVGFDDGYEVEMHSRDAILHDILWLPFRHFNIPIPSEHTYEVFPMRKSTIANVQTIQYAYFLDILDTDHLKIVATMFDAIYDIFAYAYEYLGYYQEPLDLLDFIQVYKAPELQHLFNPRIPTTMGTSIAETEMARRSKELYRMLSTAGAVKDNPLLTGMQAGIFKESTLMQLFIALGPRSDIDGRMLPHIIDKPIIDGLSSMADMATEAASSRLTTRYNKTVIRLTQSFNREMRLFTCNLTKTYSGDCGRRMYIEHQIMDDCGHNYIDKTVLFNEALVNISRDNYRSFEGKMVKLVSPIACSYVDGVCEHCAGRATTRPWAYMPKARPGGHASTILCSLMSQNILSAKHFNHTSTVKLILTTIAREYFMQDASGNIKFNRAVMKDYKNSYLILDATKMGHLNDLEYDGLSPEGFGIIDGVTIYNGRTGHSESFMLSENNLLQSVSQAFLDHMRDNRGNIELVDKHYKIPLDGFNTRKTAFDVIEINDDMVAFSRRVKSIFNSGISDYSNIQIALQHIVNTIYSKLDINIFFVELIIKAILNGVLPEDGKVNINKLGVGIAQSNVATKLGHGDVKRYLMSPDVSVVRKKKSPFDMLMGF